MWEAGGPVPSSRWYRKYSRGLFVEPVWKWMEEKSQKAPTVNLSAVGRPLHNIYMISTSLFILIVGIISVFLPSLSLSKIFLVSIIAIFRASLTQLCILAPLACWLVLSADLIASHKNLQQSNLCQEGHSSYKFYWRVQQTLWTMRFK